MAAHVYTALLDIYTTDYGQDLQFHLEHAGFADQMDPEDWHALYEAADPGKPHWRIQELVKDMLPRYTAEWVLLNKPCSLEEWLQHKYVEAEDAA